MTIRTLIGVVAISGAGAVAFGASPAVAARVNEILDLAVAGWLQTLLQLATSIGSAVGAVIYINREVRDVRGEVAAGNKAIRDEITGLARDLGRVEGFIEQHAQRGGSYAVPPVPPSP